MPKSFTAESIRAATDCLTQAGYRVIRPLEFRDTYSETRPPEKLVSVAILDTETTGTNTAKDKIIELGIVFVEICQESGQAFRVTKVFDELEDPGMPIPPESTKIHNITNAMVAGKRINDAEVNALMANVALVVAHNAQFDRAFVEQRFPVFQEKYWACSHRQVPWSVEGIGSAKLEFLAYHFGFHFPGHRASNDCHALLEVLQQPLPASGDMAMKVLLTNARRPEIKVSALGSPFESKDALKERGYRWNADDKVWATSVAKQDLEAEVSWLKENIYRGKGFRLAQETMTGKNRFSNRAGNIETVWYD